MRDEIWQLTLNLSQIIVYRKIDGLEVDCYVLILNPIQDGHFWGCSRTGGVKKAPPPKIRHTYPTMMKLGTVTPYLKKI